MNQSFLLPGNGFFPFHDRADHCVHPFNYPSVTSALAPLALQENRDCASFPESLPQVILLFCCLLPTLEICMCLIDGSLLRHRSSYTRISIFIPALEDSCRRLHGHLGLPAQPQQNQLPPAVKRNKFPVCWG